MSNIDTLRHAYADLRREVPMLPDPIAEHGLVLLRELSELSARVVREHYQPGGAEVSDLLDWCNEFRRDAGLVPHQAAI